MHGRKRQVRNGIELGDDGEAIAKRVSLLQLPGGKNLSRHNVVTGEHSQLYARPARAIPMRLPDAGVPPPELLEFLAFLLSQPERRNARVGPAA